MVVTPRGGTSFESVSRMAASLNFTKQTSTVALVFLIVYSIYGLFRVPFVQYLTCLAVAGIVYGITDSTEWAAIGALLANFLFPFVNPHMAGVEGFSSQTASKGREGFAMGNDDPEKIKARLAAMRVPGTGAPVMGVGSPMTEGFENAGEADHTLNQGHNAPTAANQPPVATTAAANNSAPASQPAPAVNQVVPPPNTPPSNAAQTTQGFQDNGGLFKLGQIPTDQKGGFHIDAGTTVINALNALKPEQMNAMTRDTKQLIETQKSLMGMLQTFQPMMNEGKQMMDTFNEMFGPTSGALQNSQNLLAGALKQQ